MPRRFIGVVAVLTIAASGAGVLIAGASRGDDTNCTVASAEAMATTLTAASHWADRALLDDNSFVYEYDRETDELSDDYHYVRHAGMEMALYLVAAEGDHSVLATADAGLDFLLARAIGADDRVAIAQPGRDAILGTTALTVVALIHRRLATGDRTHDDTLRGLGRHMQSSTTTDGVLWSHASNPDLAPHVGRTSTFYTGEAFWAFALLANTFPDEGWDELAERVGRYIATQRDVDEDVSNPPLADQWAAYGFSEMRTWDRLDADELSYVRGLIERYHDRLLTEIGREIVRVGDDPATPNDNATIARGAGFGTTVEALGALWRLSVADAGLADLEPQLRDDLVCGGSILVARQATAEQAQAWPRPPLVEGAWYDEHVSRVDDQQHAMIGVLLAIAAR